MKRVFSLVLALFAAQMMFAGKFIVTNTSDDVKEKGSLRWACATATAEDTIVFKFDKDGYKTIHISSSLSTVASIDGSTWDDQIIIDGYDEENLTKGKFNGFDKIGPFIKKLIVINCSVGISVYDSKNPQILNCYICDNHIGIKNSNTIAKISDCLISGNDSVGVLNQGEITILSNNIIGLSEDQKSAYPNGTGVYSQGRGVKFGEFTDNVVSGNSKNGIEDLGDLGISVFANNYIGTNKFFDKDEKLGNVENGFVPNVGSYGGYPVFSDNYFGNNGGYAIYRPNYSSSVTLKNNYIGITPDGSAMPNGKGGILWGALPLTLEDCKIGYNKGSGIVINTAGRNLIVKGGTVAYNKGNGIDISSDDTDNLTVENVIFDSNTKSAISVDLAFKYNKSYKSLLTENKFLHTVKPSPAFSTTKPYPVPEFTSCKITEKTIEIVGKVDTAVKAKIELFYTPQGEQTAMMLVDSFYTKADGTFSVSLDRSKLADKSIIGFAATATYNKYNTSPLSSVVYPELGKVDLTRTEFYVKMDGIGDGSSWEKAMSPQTFAYYLPQVKAGSTFHVAEGRYLPVNEDKNGYREFKINSSVSIIGGYPENAKTGATPDPKQYKTIFTGDQSGDDSYIVDGRTSGSYLGYVVDPSNDDINVEALFNADATSKLYFYGCGFKGVTVKYDYDKERHVSSPIYANSIKLEKCEFDVAGTTWAADKSKASKLEASECIFRNRPSCSSPSSIFSCDTLKVEKSMFENMSGTSGGCFSRVGKAIFIENSTFNDIVSSSSLYEGGKLSALHLLNNTFNNLTESGSYNSNFARSSENTDIKIIGNIFVNCSYSAVIDEVLDNCEVRDNLCSGNTVGTKLDLQTDNIDDVLDWLNGAPVLKDNGGFTPTVALKSDTLSNGTSIRFPRLDDVLTDQRGVSRQDNTCMGAYEIGCNNVFIFTEDTVFVGTKIYGQTFTTVGMHDSIVENLQSKNGCDSVLIHNVVVIPDPKVMNYYVKTKKAGKGDGSSWENAMDGEMFAMYLPFVSGGTTFHVAEGRYLPVNEGKNGYREFKINSSVSIIGGYPENAKTGATPDPKQYKTIFTGDPSGDDSYIVDGRTSGSYLGHIVDPSNDDINVEALFNADATSKLYFYGCGFKGVTVKYDYDKERHVSSPIYANSIKLEKCEFDVAGTTWAADKSKASKLEASECIFRNRPSCSSPSSVFSCDTLKVEKSLFESMDGHSGGCFSRVNKAMFIENSTFNDIVSSSSLYEGGKLSALHLLNNTFNNLSESGSLNAYFAKSTNAADIKIIGNIFVKCSYSAVIDNVPDSCEVRNNLCSGNTVGTDLDLQAENLESVLEWDSAAPVLKDNGGFTPTIALKKDVLSDGKSIRFPRLAKITTDQRGVSRQDNTCMGAYEIGCNNVFIFTEDTVFVGTKIYGQTFTTVGVHDSIVENLQSKNGCDSVLIHNVVVIPDPKVMNYYVKTKKAGKGDGSSWENAMDGEMFAMYLPFVSGGTTFHVAEGRYLPVNEDKNGYREFKINSSVSIIGGYPENAKTGATPDPKQYKTIFTGDPSGDDSYIVDGRTSGSYLGHITDPSNDDINVSALFNANSTSNLYFYGCGFKGVTVKYDYDEERHVSSPIYANFIKLEKCEFDVVGTTWAADKSKVSKLEASECIFRNRPSCSSPSSVFSCDSLKIEKSLFDGMEGHSGGCFARVTKAIKIENSTFNNVTSSSTLCEGSKLAELYLLNNTFNNLNESGSRNANFARSSENTDIKIIGNIFVNCSYSAIIDEVLDSCEVRNNLCSGNTVGTDLDLQAENLESVLEWDSTPVLKDNGGFTPTIALKKDVLLDGKSIRFPRLAKITTDQRGVSRPDMACVGAYEKDVETVVDEVNGSVCEIYPNPVKDELNVSGVDVSFSYEIIDLTGRTVARGKSVGTIGVSELSNGVYLLKLQTEKQQSCVRFVKQ